MIKHWDCKRAEQQSYRSCMRLLKLADKYSVDRLEAACEKALIYTASPSYKNIKSILVARQDRHVSTDDADIRTITTQNSHAITRGADYYRRQGTMTNKESKSRQLFCTAWPLQKCRRLLL